MATTTNRDPMYSDENANRTVYTRESNSTAWFVGIVVVLALLAIGYLVFMANNQPQTPATINAPAVTNTLPGPTAPADTTNLPNTNTTPMAPATTTPAPADTTPAPADTTPAPADTTPAPATTTPAPAANP